LNCRCVINFGPTSAQKSYLDTYCLLHSEIDESTEIFNHFV
jgi:hypothetical protein